MSADVNCNYEWPVLWGIDLFKEFFSKALRISANRRVLDALLSDMTEAQFYYKTESFDNNF